MVFSLKITLRTWMLTVAVFAFLIYAALIRQVWVQRYDKYEFWCVEVAATELALVLTDYRGSFCSFGMARLPKEEREERTKESRLIFKSILLRDLEYSQKQKNRYARGLWRLWLPLDPAPSGPFDESSF